MTETPYEQSIEYPFLPPGAGRYQNAIIIRTNVLKNPADIGYVTADEYLKLQQDMAKELSAGVQAILKQLLEDKLIELATRPKEQVELNTKETPVNRDSNQGPNKDENPRGAEQKQDNYGNWKTDPPTEKQYNFLTTLMRDKFLANERFEFEKEHGWGPSYHMTKGDMKMLLDHLCAIKDGRRDG